MRPNQNPNLMLQLSLHPRHRSLLRHSLQLRPILCLALPNRLVQLAQVSNKQSYPRGQSLSLALLRLRPSLICLAAPLLTNPSNHARTRHAAQGALHPDSPHLQNRLLGSYLALVLLSLTKPALLYLRLLSPSNSPQNQPPNQEDLPVQDLGQVNPQDLSLHSRDLEALLSSNNSLFLRTPPNLKLVVLFVRQTSM